MTGIFMHMQRETKFIESNITQNEIDSCFAVSEEAFNEMLQKVKVILHLFDSEM